MTDTLCEQDTPRISMSALAVIVAVVAYVAVSVALSYTEPLSRIHRMMLRAVIAIVLLNATLLVHLWERNRGHDD